MISHESCDWKYFENFDKIEKRIDVLEDWALHTTRPSEDRGWKTTGKRKITFLSDSCSNDERQLSKLQEFQETCHNHIFVQYDFKACKLSIAVILYIYSISKNSFKSPNSFIVRC